MTRLPRIVVTFDRLHRRMMLQSDHATSNWLREPGPQAIILNISRLVEGWKVDDDPPPWARSRPPGIETPTSIAEMLNAEFARAYPERDVMFVSAASTRRAP